ncbi:hypothetical protein [Legionella sp. 16cNR16C]|uniref:hypothetical protein n=1 Tax=Legionella sp. 16cNR16C TaxID=2905656 RepID=UPI001E35AD0B|nr:hypothetical protein [Legionella sp. 16cNR16C]MCE3045028.1 hypothetical protein [Legionella sp. 16cNR16C]
MSIELTLGNIWDKTNGSEVEKAHAVLKEYFQARQTSRGISALTNSGGIRERAIDFFNQQKSLHGEPLNSISDLVIAAASISQGPALAIYIGFILEKQEQAAGLQCEKSQPYLSM